MRDGRTLRHARLERPFASLEEGPPRLLSLAAPTEIEKTVDGYILLVPLQAPAADTNATIATGRLDYGKLSASTNQ